MAVITVAHRLNTIIESDHVVVLDQGHVIEQGHPLELLVNDPEDNLITADTLFAEMVKESKVVAGQLLEKARQAYYWDK